MRKSELIAVGIVIILFAVGIYMYRQLPDTIASHWNAQGQANRYMSKLWGVFLSPVISVGLVLLLVAIPRIDPLKANIEEFRPFYDRFVVLFMVFFFYFYLLTILWNSGMRYNFVQVLAPAFGGLFYYLGVVIEHAKRNWFVGIRTPWTLSSENVWDKTHADRRKTVQDCRCSGTPRGSPSKLCTIFRSYPSARCCRLFDRVFVLCLSKGDKLGRSIRQGHQLKTIVNVSVSPAEFR